MKMIKYIPKEHSRQWINTYSKFIIPVPNIQIQNEIVEILDNFTGLLGSLNNELEKRQIQYQCYIKKLLTFNKNVFKKFDDYCIISKGEYITKKTTIEGQIPVILGGKTPAYYINKSNHSGKVIVISRSGMAGFVTFWDGDIFVSDGFMVDTKNGLEIKFLYYYLKSIQDYLLSLKRGGALQHITSKHISNLSIPVPPLSEQEKIVSILDNFDNLCNNTKTGLPAEIEKVQKQYEYYRDKLLDFKQTSE